MWPFNNKKKKTEEYRKRLSEKIQYLRAVEGGEPIIRLLDLMMTAIDYKFESKTSRRLTRNVGMRLGGGYLGYPQSTQKILEAALTYAEFTLNQGKTMTLKEWHDACFTIAISLETQYGTALREAEDLKKKNAELGKKLNEARKASEDRDRELLELGTAFEEKTREARMWEGKYDEMKMNMRQSSSLKIAKDKRTSIVMVLNAMYKANWIVGKDGERLSNRDKALNEILQNAFGVEGDANISQLLSAPKMRGGKQGTEYIEELRNYAE